MKKTLALACFVVLASALLAAAEGLSKEDQKLYSMAKEDASISVTYKTALAQLGEPDEKNAQGWRIFLTDYMGHMMSKRNVDSTKTSDTTKKIAGACDNGHLFDGSLCTPAATVTQTASTAAVAQTTSTATGPLTDSNRAKANLTASTPPPQGDTPSEKKDPDDPNKWNATIAGGKAAIWAGLIGFILGGPVGLMTCALLGFGAGYFIHKMS